jgi:hypothetical protein
MTTGRIDRADLRREILFKSRKDEQWFVGTRDDRLVEGLAACRGSMSASSFSHDIINSITVSIQEREFSILG